MGRLIMCVTAVVYFLAALGGMNLIITLLQQLERLFAFLSTREVTGKDGTARWATYKEVKPELNQEQTGPFWGGIKMMMKSKKALFMDFVSNTMCIAPAGSGKGIGTVITNILSIHGNKVTVDFKGEIYPIVQQTLRDRGELVIPLNPSGLWPDIIGESADYNHLEMIVHNLYRKDGIKDMLSALWEISAQLYPEPEGKSNIVQSGV